MSDLSDNLRSLRKKLNLSQQDLADRMNTSKQVISRYERGERDPKTETLFKLADALGVSPWELIGWDYTVEEGHCLAPEWDAWQQTHGEKGGISSKSKEQEESDILKKWNALDNYGKCAVKAVLDVEYERVQDDISKEDP